MRRSAPPDVTGLVRDLAAGHAGGLNRLIPLVYEDLQRIAHRQLRHERSGHTLCTTALVHESYLKLLQVRQIACEDRTHFFALAARLMRRILIDHARARVRSKRGGHRVRVALSAADELAEDYSSDVLDLNEALIRLEAINERQCRVVEYRCIAGLSVEETAEALGTSAATVKRDWAFARAWLNRELATIAAPEQAT